MNQQTTVKMQTVLTSLLAKIQVSPTFVFVTALRVSPLILLFCNFNSILGLSTRAQADVSRIRSFFHTQRPVPQTLFHAVRRACIRASYRAIDV